MNKEIEVYRGFEITINTETGKFNSWSDRYDTEFSKPSLISARKGVDEYIKNNNKFKPFKIQKVFNYGSEVELLGEVLTIVGIRKDSGLVYESEGKKKYVSKSDFRYFALHDSGNTVLKEDLNILELNFDEVRKKYFSDKKALFSQVKAVPLTEKVRELVETFLK